MRKRKCVLLDMDGVIANFELGFLNIWQNRYPGRFFIPMENRTKFYQHDEYPAQFHQDIWNIYLEPGFFLGLPPVEDAIEGVQAVIKAGHKVFICTTPFDYHQNCVGEKYQWIEEHLGRECTKRIILTHDKTMVRGNFLIDDKPEITGHYQPTWKHVVYDKPYNRHIRTQFRMTWPSWREVIGA